MEGLNNKEVHKKEYEEVRNRVLEKEIINLNLILPEGGKKLINT